ncbi:hypothetical protein BpHYR1_054424 [Brachionus plicatilis]|uniref:Uncharacterized protein n=1 Tax=Brachionus plicatilis TaxID=10195 RepID=A0A3M7SEK3_BRAPC|nr:hypothetical protein BpHYR1_054424 [Brachionus plicatilis]
MFGLDEVGCSDFSCKGVFSYQLKQSIPFYNINQIPYFAEYKRAAYIRKNSHHRPASIRIEKANFDA